MTDGTMNTRTTDGVAEWIDELRERGVTNKHLVDCFLYQTPVVVMELLDRNELSPRFFQVEDTNKEFY